MQNQDGRTAQVRSQPDLVSFLKYPYDHTSGEKDPKNKRFFQYMVHKV